MIFIANMQCNININYDEVYSPHRENTMYSDRWTNRLTVTARYNKCLQFNMLKKLVPETSTLAHVSVNLVQFF